MAFLELKNISKRYGKTEETKVHALKSVNLKIEEGSYLAIMGKSGSGKSTLLNVLGGLTRPTDGVYIFNGENVSNLSRSQGAVFRNQNIGFVVQNFALIHSMTVKENVRLPLIYGSYRRKEIDRRVKKILEKMELADKIHAYPSELSGGQCQRVAIARAMIAEPKLILADEPTGALDQETGKRIMDLFSELNAQGATVIIVTHDKDVATRCGRRLYMEDGSVFE